MLTIHFDKFAAIVLSILLVISSLSCKEKRKEIQINQAVVPVAAPPFDAEIAYGDKVTCLGVAIRPL